MPKRWLSSTFESWALAPIAPGLHSKISYQRPLNYKTRVSQTYRQLLVFKRLDFGRWEEQRFWIPAMLWKGFDADGPFNSVIQLCGLFHLPVIGIRPSVSSARLSTCRRENDILLSSGYSCRSEWRLRVLAHISGDEHLIDAPNMGRSPYIDHCCGEFSCTLENQKMWRQNDCCGSLPKAVNWCGLLEFPTLDCLTTRDQSERSQGHHWDFILNALPVSRDYTEESGTGSAWQVLQA